LAKKLAMTKARRSGSVILRFAGEQALELAAGKGGGDCFQSEALAGWRARRCGRW